MCCATTRDAWAFIDGVMPYVGRPPWFEFVQVYDEDTCISYCRYTAKETYCKGPDICSIYAATSVTGAADSPTAEIVTVAPSQAVRGLQGAKDDSTTHEGVPTLAGLRGSSVSQLGNADLASRQWAWECLSSVANDQVNHCLADPSRPSVMDRNALTTALQTMQSNPESNVCRVDGMCGQYNGHCCGIFAGGVGSSNSAALVADNCSDGDASGECYNTVDQLFACIQNEQTC